MHELIDIYIKRHNRWLYAEGSRMSATLAQAEQRFSSIYGEPVKAKFAERVSVSSRKTP